MNKTWKSLLHEAGYDQCKTNLERISCFQRIFANLFPFENIDVLLQNDQPITKAFLKEKLLQHGRGGLCYELNGLLYILLKEAGMDVTLSVATVFIKDNWTIDKTHTVILYYEDNNLYLIDSGSGNNLPLQPLQLDGPSITSHVGIFRLRSKDTEKGSIVSEKLTEDGWMLRYALYPKPVGWDDLNRIKKLIHTHVRSPFNQTLLIAKTDKDGSYSINEGRFQRTFNHGDVDRMPFENNDELLSVVKKYSSISIYQAVQQYLVNYNNYTK